MSVSSVLLIGGSGFLGLHLIEQFSKHCPGCDIHVFDVRPLPDKISSYFSFDPKTITVHTGDLTSAADVGDAIVASKCDVVVHAASPLPGSDTPVFIKVNVDGTKNIIDQCKKLSVKALIYTSLASVIFNGADTRNANETWPYAQPHMDSYNETKAIAEVAVLAADDPNGLRTVAVRPSGIFGPGDRQLVPGLRAAARLGQSKFQIGDNNNICDWTYVGNVADGHVLAAQKALLSEHASNVGGQAFIVTNDAPTYFWTLARTVWKADGIIDKRYIVLPRALGLAVGYVSEYVSKLSGREPGLTPFRVRIACAHRYHDITKAKLILGYSPVVDLETGIKHTLDWMDEML